MTSCWVVDAQKPKYELAQMHRVKSQLGERLGRLETDGQLRTA